MGFPMLKQRSRASLSRVVTSGSPMTKAELIAELAASSAELIVETVFDQINEALVRGQKVKLRDFGVFDIQAAQCTRRPQSADRQRGAGSREDGAVFLKRQGDAPPDQPSRSRRRRLACGVHPPRGHVATIWRARAGSRGMVSIRYPDH
jgi:hypothetical protein